MFSSKGCYKRINKIQEKPLKFILNDYESPFDRLLSVLNEKSDSSTLHKRFINQSIEMFKQLLPPLINEVFYVCQNHDMKKHSGNWGRDYFGCILTCEVDLTSTRLI